MAMRFARTAGVFAVAPRDLLPVDRIIADPVFQPRRGSWGRTCTCHDPCSCPLLMAPRLMAAAGDEADLGATMVVPLDTLPMLRCSHREPDHPEPLVTPAARRGTRVATQTRSAKSDPWNA